jgi:hypothetical protein
MRKVATRNSEEKCRREEREKHFDIAKRKTNTRQAHTKAVRRGESTFETDMYACLDARHAFTHLHARSLQESGDWKEQKRLRFRQWS